MCDYCGAEFEVVPAHPRGFAVTKYQRGALVILDHFKSEIEAEVLAAQLHQDRIREHAMFRGFVECSQL